MVGGLGEGGQPRAARDRRGAIGGSVFAIVVAVLLVAMGWWLISGYREQRRTLELTEFEECGQEFKLAAGYSAYDYRSPANEELAPGQRLFDVRSSEPGLPAPARIEDVIAVMPAKLRESWSVQDYQRWVTTGFEAGAAAVASRVPVANAEVGGCNFYVVLSSGRPLGPRSGDWTIQILRTRLD